MVTRPVPSQVPEGMGTETGYIHLGAAKRCWERLATHTKLTHNPQCPRVPTVGRTENVCTTPAISGSQNRGWEQMAT